MVVVVTLGSSIGGVRCRMDAIRVDVTKDADVDAAVQHVRQSGSDLWAVINNAGINGGLYVEWNSVRDYERVMSVNFFGGVRVIKAFVPLLVCRLVLVECASTRIEPRSVARCLA